MEERALWQYTKYVYASQVDTFTFDDILTGVVERVEDQCQIHLTTKDLEIRFDEPDGLEVFQVSRKRDSIMAISPGRMFIDRHDGTYGAPSPVTPPPFVTENTDIAGIGADHSPGTGFVRLDTRDQLTSLVQDSQLSTLFTFADLSLLGDQIHQLSAFLAAATDTAALDDVHLTEVDENSL
eukprot:s2939_g9.t1